MPALLTRVDEIDPSPLLVEKQNFFLNSFEFAWIVELTKHILCLSELGYLS